MEMTEESKAHLRRNFITDRNRNDESKKKFEWKRQKAESDRK
jgi:hypothetical protein